MRSLKSLAAYGFVATNILFSFSRCTAEQQSWVDTKDMQLQAWDALDPYQHVDQGELKNYLSAAYADLLMDSDTLEDGQRHAQQKKYVVADDTLHTRLFVDKGGIIKAVYDLPHDRFAEVVFSNFADNGAYPRQIIKREETRLTAKTVMVDEKVYAPNLDSLRYTPHTQSTIFYQFDGMDNPLIADAVIAVDLDDPALRHVSMSYYRDNDGPCMTLDEDGLHVMKNEPDSLGQWGYETIAGVSADAFQEFVNDVKDMVLDVTQEPNMPKTFVSRLGNYFEMLMHENAARTQTAPSEKSSPRN